MELTNQRQSGWNYFKKKTQIYAAARRLISTQKTNVQSEDTKNDTPNKWQPKESRCSHIHATQKKIQAMKGHKGGHSIMIKGTTYQENIQLLLYIYLT